MKKRYSIQLNESEKIVFDVPSRLSDITIQELTDYELKFKSFPIWFQEFNGDVNTLSKNQEASYIHYALELFSLYTKTDLTILKNIADLQSILEMWHTLHEAMFFEEPQRIESFEYKGKTFIVPKQVINKITGAAENPNLNTWETILALQYEFIMNETEIINKGGNYHRKLAIVSVLCRKQNEILPLSDADCTQFVTDRMLFFKDLDAATVENVMFFFTISLAASKRIGIASMLLRVLKRN